MAETKIFETERMRFPGLHPDAFTAETDRLALEALRKGGLALAILSNGEPRMLEAAARIVETEAYRGPDDRACHAYGGRRTPRTRTMYEVGGTAYVYFVYGMYHQFNVVTSVEDVAHAVLVRAVEPVEGIERMRERRPGRADRHLTSGPGKLCLAFGIDRGLDRADLLGEQVWIEEGRGRVPRAAVATGPRIGVAYAGAWATRPWRFWIRSSPHVSRR